MGQATLSGPVRAGTVREGATPNVGNVTLSQTGLINQNSTTTVDLTFYVPDGSRIVDIIVDVLTAYNSVTSATLTMGTASVGVQYASGVDVKTATGRIRPTFTATQLTNMASTPLTSSSTPPAIVASVAVVGATSTGQVRVTLVYVQN